MHDDLTAAGWDRWQILLAEAEERRRERRVAPAPRGRFRERLESALVALATRLAPAVAGATAPGHPAS